MLTTAAILDLILTSRDELVSKMETVGTLGGSDHAVSRFVILRKRMAENSRTCTLDFMKVDFGKFRK